MPALSFFVECALKNYANHGGHWTGKAGYQKALRDKTHILALEHRDRWPSDAMEMTAAMPKCVTMTAYVWNYFDTHDGLRNACKPLVDGLVRARFLDDDRPQSGHQFLYTQVIDRTHRGVQITIEPR